MRERFDIQPYIGALPITFGMVRERVHQLLGPPETRHPIWNGSGVVEHYNAARYNVGYTNDGVVNHVGFSPGGAELSILGRPLWTADDRPDPNPTLIALDPMPLEWVGLWFFMGIGVTTTGYHDDDPGQRAITLFVRGSQPSEMLAAAVPADTRKYRIR